MLGRRARTRAELERTLETRGFPAAVIRAVLARIGELGYVDDGRFAADASERLAERGYGRLRIETELVRRGLPEAVVEAVLPRALDDEKRARELLASRFSRDELRDRRRRGRAARYLVTRGFDPDLVRSLLPDGAEP
jgi:regulatory protein